MLSRTTKKPKTVAPKRSKTVAPGASLSLSKMTQMRLLCAGNACSDSDCLDRTALPAPRPCPSHASTRTRVHRFTHTTHTQTHHARALDNSVTVRRDAHVAHTHPYTRPAGSPEPVLYAGGDGAGSVLRVNGLDLVPVEAFPLS